MITFFITQPSGGYLAARALTRSGTDSVTEILDQPDWSLMHETMRFFSAFNDIQPYLKLVQKDDSLLREKFIRASLWLVNIDPKSSTELDLLKILTREIQTNTNYMIKIRLVIALIKILKQRYQGHFPTLVKIF